MPSTGPEPQTIVEEKRLGAPRWMWTFSDLMSLLFALFVMLLTFADFDPGRFERTAEGVRANFGQTRGPPDDRGTRQGIIDIRPPSLSGRVVDDVDMEKVEELEAWERLRERTVEDLRAKLFDELSDGRVSLRETERGVLLRFPSESTFASGESALKAAVEPSLLRVAEVLAGVDGKVTVSGHTDDVPISTDRYRSNWDLSTARAVSVVHFLLESGGLDAGRVAASGFAESRPLAPNETPDGRARNRRVEIELEIMQDAAADLGW